MKYVLIFALIAILVRIDVVLRLFDRATSYFNQNKATVVESKETKSSPAIVPVKDDRFIHQTPRARFINILETFGQIPDPTLREKAMEVFKASPTMFTEKLDPALESAVFSWRDLISQGSAELPPFLLDLLTILHGENKDMVTKFYSLIIDQNLPLFLSSYSKSRDINCLIVNVVGDRITEEEKRNVLYDREKALNEFSQSEKADPTQKRIADTCLLKLRTTLTATPTPEPVSPTPSPFSSPSLLPQTIRP
jgi:hypothetical protein